MTDIEATTAATVGGALVWGLALALWATLKRDMTQTPSPEAPPGVLATSLNAALVPLTLLAGVLTDRLGAQAVLILGSVMLAVALLWLSTRPTWPRDFVAVNLAGFGSSAVGVATLVLMPRGFFGPAEAMASVSLGCVFTALGALAATALLDVLRATLGRKRALALLAFVCLIPAFPAALAGQGVLQAPGRHADVVVLVEQGSVWLAALVFFFYAPLEAAVALWTTNTQANLLDEKGRGGGLVIGFWAGFLVSRLAVAVIEHAGWLSTDWEVWWLVLPALLAAVSLGNLAGATSGARLQMGVWALGAVLGPVFPALAGVVLRNYGNEAGTTYGLLFAAGSIGSLLMASLPLPRPVRPTDVFKVPIFLALALTASCLLFALTMS
jgi:hypothetical protein